jgi:putative aldouronate transport system substrate-binding protein
VAWLLAACSSSKSDQGGEASQTGDSGSPSSSVAVDPSSLKPVELIYYYTGAVQKDNALVEAEMNKILKKKINATIKLKQIDYGSFEQKMNLLNATGEKYDLAFTSSWMNNFVQNVNKNAFAPMDELLGKYAPKLKASMAEKVWNAARINGKLYAVPNQQVWAFARGFYIRKDQAEKYHLDVSTIKKAEDIEPFFYQILQNEKGVTPLALETMSSLTMLADGVYDSVGSQATAVKMDDPTLKVVNINSTPEFTHAFELADKWYKKGYINKDVASIKDMYTDFKAGKYAVLLNAIKPGGDQDVKIRIGYDLVHAAVSPPYISSSNIQATMTAISRTSANPERAMMFLELINTDKELYNLLCHGIEGTHYVKVSDNLIKYPDGVTPQTSSYSPASDWMFGNQFNSYYVSPDQVGAWEETKKLNDSALISPLLGFNFTPDKVKTQLAQVNNSNQELWISIGTGAVPVTELPQYMDKVKQSGVDDIIAEAQKQIDAWKSSAAK